MRRIGFAAFHGVGPPRPHNEVAFAQRLGSVLVQIGSEALPVLVVFDRRPHIPFVVTVDVLAYQIPFTGDLPVQSHFRDEIAEVSVRSLKPVVTLPPPVRHQGYWVFVGIVDDRGEVGDFRCGVEFGSHCRMDRAELRIQAVQVGGVRCFRTGGGVLGVADL